MTRSWSLRQLARLGSGRCLRTRAAEVSLWEAALPAALPAELLRLPEEVARADARLVAAGNQADNPGSAASFNHVQPQRSAVQRDDRSRIEFRGGCRGRERGSSPSLDPGRAGAGRRPAAGRSRRPPPSRRASRPNSAATDAAVWPSSPTRRHASRPARLVSDARGRIASCVSVQVCFPAPRGSWQRHTRFTHTSVTGRPAAGRSRTSSAAGRGNLSRTPHDQHQPDGEGLDRLLHLAVVLRHGQHPEPRACRAWPWSRYRRHPPGTSSDGWR
jgi:hypothetical protein